MKNKVCSRADFFCFRYSRVLPHQPSANSRRIVSRRIVSRRVVSRRVVSRTDIVVAGSNRITVVVADIDNTSSYHRGNQIFSGLNTLRFIAAMLVVWAHGEAIRAHRGIPSLEHLSIFHNGGLAVSFFFVLSGFLITTLLLREADSFGTVSVRMFYQRRCMRILPLYFLLVILGVGVIPVALPIVGIDYQISYAPWTTTVWYLALLPFVVNVYYDVFVIGPLWSIGVEEWYYLLIAPVVKYFATTVRVVFAGVIVTKVIMLVLVDAHVIGGVHASFVTMLSFEHMAAGGITALAVRHFRSRNELQSPVQSKTWKLISWTLMTVLIVRLIAHERIAATFPAFRFIVDSYAATSIMDMGLFSLLLYVIVIQPPLCTTKIAKWTEHLGEYSYGIYMYHNVVAFALTFGLAAQWRVLSVLMGTTLYHILLATITIAIAAVSRHTFEEYFLRKQKRPVSLA